jgi:hypothetical protein
MQGCRGFPPAALTSLAMCKCALHLLAGAQCSRGSLRLTRLAVAPFFTRFPEFLERFGIIFYKFTEILATRERAYVRKTGKALNKAATAKRAD